MLALLFLPATAMAADFPDQDGYVTDEAGILSGSDIAAIEEAVKRASFDLYVYTTDDLNGTPIDEYATSLYSAWSLQADDALLIVDMGYREAYLEMTINSKLERALLNSVKYSGQDSYSRLLDETFIPYAIDGDFGGAIVAVINELEQLLSVYNQGTAAPANPGTGKVPPRQHHQRRQPRLHRPPPRQRTRPHLVRTALSSSVSSSGWPCSLPHSTNGLSAGL